MEQTIKIIGWSEGEAPTEKERLTMADLCSDQLRDPAQGWHTELKGCCIRLVINGPVDRADVDWMHKTIRLKGFPRLVTFN